VCLSDEMLSVKHLCGDRVGEADVPPNSFSSIEDFNTIGTGTNSPLKPGVAPPVTVAAGPDGMNRYSSSVKCPSGGTNDKDLSRVHLWRLYRNQRLVE
jgi:hypothetical protein